MPKGTTKNKGRKDELDRFYTKPEVAAALVDHLLAEHPEWKRSKHFVEPSAGDGAFVRALEDAGVSHVHAFDIMPAKDPMCSTEIVENDYLDGDIFSKSPELAGVERDDIVVIGNPPFGEQAKLAVAFVDKSLEIAGICAFILPPSFYKESVQKKFSGAGAVVEVVGIDDIEYRVVEAGLRDVPSSFFVFDAFAQFRELPNHVDRLPFKFLPGKDRDKADFIIRRVGGTAGCASSDIHSMSRESCYFCAREDGCPEDIIEIISGCEYPERDWTVGPRSLSQKEIAKNIYEQRPDICR